jgi:hypothetical protein
MRWAVNNGRDLSAHSVAQQTWVAGEFTTGHLVCFESSRLRFPEKPLSMYGPLWDVVVSFAASRGLSGSPVLEYMRARVCIEASSGRCRCLEDTIIIFENISKADTATRSIRNHIPSLSNSIMIPTRDKVSAWPHYFFVESFIPSLSLSFLVFFLSFFGDVTEYADGFVFACYIYDITISRDR